MKRLLLFFLLFYQETSGQIRNFDSVENKIAKIKAHIKLINSDSSMSYFSFVDTFCLSNDNNTIEGKFKLTGQAKYTSYYNQENALQRISISTSIYSNQKNNLKEYYFSKGKLIYIYHNYINNSRPDACGSIEFKISLFFDSDNLIGMESHKWPNVGPTAWCYPIAISEDEIYRQLAEVLYKIGQYKNNNSH